MEQDKNKTFGTRIILAIGAGKDSDRGNKVVLEWFQDRFLQIFPK